MCTIVYLLSGIFTFLYQWETNLSQLVLRDTLCDDVVIV